jgi:hypothetical protein
LHIAIAFCNMHQSFMDPDFIRKKLVFSGNIIELMPPCINFKYNMVLSDFPYELTHQEWTSVVYVLD